MVFALIHVWMEFHVRVPPSGSGRRCIQVHSVSNRANDDLIAIVTLIAQLLLGTIIQMFSWCGQCFLPAAVAAPALAALESLEVPLANAATAASTPASNASAVTAAWCQRLVVVILVVGS